MLSWDERALAVLERLHRAGFQAVLVGGCVRDSLLSIPPHDYDAATSARPEQIEAACRDLRCVETGIQHGTVTVLSGGLPVEVTTFRKEGVYTDHRHPDRVEFTGELTQDLARRDFTVNAIAWSPAGLTDPFGGQRDLAARTIRCVGRPERRFAEDALRMLRGLRLAAQLSFSMEEETAAAIHRGRGGLEFVAWERITAELVRLLCAPGAERVLLDFPDVVTQVLPELAPAVGFPQHNPHHIWDVYTHSVKALAQTPPRPALRLAALLHDAGKPETFTRDENGVGHFYGHPGASAALAERAFARLRLDNATRDRALVLIRRHDLPVEDTPRWARRWLARLGPEVLLDLLALKRADRLACAPEEGDSLALLDRTERTVRQVLEEAPCLTLKDLAVNGRDAQSVGLRGPAIGAALRGLLELVVEGEVENQRERLMEKMREYC